MASEVSAGLTPPESCCTLRRMSDTPSEQARSGGATGLLQPIIITLSLVALIVASYAAVQVRQLERDLKQVTAKAEKLEGTQQRREGQAGPRGDRHDGGARVAGAGRRGPQTPAAAPSSGSAPAPAAAPSPGRAAKIAARQVAKDEAAATKAKAAVGQQRAEELIKALAADKQTTMSVLEALGAEGRGRTRLTASAKERDMDAKTLEWRKGKLRAGTDAKVKSLVDAETFARYLELRKQWDDGK